MKITQNYIPIGKRRSGTKMSKVVFITAHDTGNPDSTAKANVNYYKNTFNETSTSAHAFVDDVEIIECVPQDEKAYHVRYDVPGDNTKYGDDANDIALGIELCYFKDVERTKKSYANYVEYIASLMKKYSLGIGSIVGHYELDSSRRTDPINAFKTIGKTWDNFIADLKDATTIKTPFSLAEVSNDELISEIKRRLP